MMEISLKASAACVLCGVFGLLSRHCLPVNELQSRQFVVAISSTSRKHWSLQLKKMQWNGCADSIYD